MSYKLTNESIKFKLAKANETVQQYLPDIFQFVYFVNVNYNKFNFIKYLMHANNENNKKN